MVLEPVIGAKLSIGQKEAFLAACAHEGKTPSEKLREIVNQWLTTKTAELERSKEKKEKEPGD